MVNLLVVISLAGMTKVERFREYQDEYRSTLTDPRTGSIQGTDIMYASAALKADPHDTGLGFALKADARMLTERLGPPTRSSPSGPEWLFRFADEPYTGFVVSVYVSEVTVREYTVRSKYRYWTVSEAQGPTIAFLVALRDSIAGKPRLIPEEGKKQ